MSMHYSASLNNKKYTADEREERENNDEENRFAIEQCEAEINTVSFYCL